MKNLNLLRNDVIKLESNDSYYQFYLNRNLNSVYLLTNNGIATCINTKNNISENFHLTTSPIKLTYLSVTAEISIIDSEQISIFDQNLNLTVSYNFTNGCKIAEYNPAQDLLAVLTNNLTVQILTIDSFGTFSLINEIELNDYKYVNQFINIGWGSKETQFHGSEGKDARKNRIIEENSDSNKISVADSNITWRGDGLLFAVTFMRGKDYAFIVLDKNGIPQYSSEICPGLESPLCWKPSGNLIAGVQQLPNKYQIVFFEKNGLRHGEFTISNKAKVKKIIWSSDSEILCILYEDNNIQLWTINNYHWYLKQSLQFAKDVPLSDLYWDPGFDTKNGKILYILYDSNVLIYEWIWNVNHSKGLNENDLACVAVIDGMEALITSFKKSSIPPPMSAVTLKMDKIINFSLFGPSDTNPNDLCLVFDDYSCNLYKCEQEPFKYELVKTFSVTNANNLPLSQNHFLWVNKNTLLCYSNKKIKKFILSNSDSESSTINEEIKVEDIVITIEAVPKTSEIIVQLINGQIWIFNLENNNFIFSLSLPSVCDVIKPCLIGEKTIIFGLDRFNRFYVNETCMANTITSFYIHSEFLLLTTSQHLLICVQLNEEGLQMLQKTAPNMFMRQIERGSRIVTAVQRGRKVVLQMPRGNLETICPRMMSLQMINNLLDANKYLDAFQIMKVERINLNIFYDYKPEQFLDNIELFINQIADPVNLNMFLLELRDEDVTKTMYSMCYTKRNDSNSNKKILIADMFVKYLSTEENKKKFLLTIVTALVIKKKQIDLESALNIIYEMKSQDRVLAEKALEHVLLLVSINELYNIALGMYNFDLIMFVATKSQKDPKEYIPFLNQLNQLKENYKKYTIDKFLKRYATALKWIAKCDDDKFDECLEFIKMHNLYKDALDIFNEQQEKYSRICETFGRFLLQKRCFIEAAIMFERCNQFENAIESYKLGSQWSHCLRCAAKLNYDNIRFNKLCLSLVDDLTTQRQYKDASIILIEHLNDPERAIEILTIHGRLWSDALRLSYVHKRLDMIETHIKPGILQHAEILQSQLETNLNEFKTKTERLKVLKNQKQSEFEDPNEQTHAIEDGLYSDTASVISKNTQTSQSTFRSFRSSKNRRKHERKLLSLKEGSKFEDIALIQFLHKLISNTYAIRQEIYDLCTHLMIFNEDKLAKKLQKTLENLLQLIKECEKEIWPQEDLNSTNNFMFGPDMTSNVASDIMKNDAVDKKTNLEYQFRYPPQQNDIHWKLFTLD